MIKPLALALILAALPAAAMAQNCGDLTLDVCPLRPNATRGQRHAQLGSDFTRDWLFAMTIATIPAMSSATAPRRRWSALKNN